MKIYGIADNGGIQVIRDKYRVLLEVAAIILSEEDIRSYFTIRDAMSYFTVAYQ